MNDIIPWDEMTAIVKRKRLFGETKIINEKERCSKSRIRKVKDSSN
jgi:hypothetical protein